MLHKTELLSMYITRKLDRVSLLTDDRCKKLVTISNISPLLKSPASPISRSSSPEQKLGWGQPEHLAAADWGACFWEQQADDACFFEDEGVSGLPPEQSFGPIG
jgi:hypothetical protein